MSMTNGIDLHVPFKYLPSPAKTLYCKMRDTKRKVWNADGI